MRKTPALLHGGAENGCDVPHFIVDRGVIWDGLRDRLAEESTEALAQPVPPPPPRAFARAELPRQRRVRDFSPRGGEPLAQGLEIAGLAVALKLRLQPRERLLQQRH